MYTPYALRRELYVEDEEDAGPVVKVPTSAVLKKLPIHCFQPQSSENLIIIDKERKKEEGRREKEVGAPHSRWVYAHHSPNLRGL